MSQLAGILVLNKPSGYTSHDCVSAVRRFTSVKRVGHTGTLDPEATGVLPICIGQATKVVPFLIEADKTYEAEIKLGVATTTEDFVGDVIENRPLDHPPSIEEVKKVFSQFIGEIEQVPPLYSAIKVKGKKLYEWARKGVQVERPVRRVKIYHLELLGYDPEVPYPRLKFLVTCSKGTYIRTLGVDIGRALGYPAHLLSLVRTRSGPYHLAESVTLSAIKEWNENEWQNHLHPIDSALQNFSALQLEIDQVKRLQQGQRVKVGMALQKGELYRVYDPRQRFVALGRALDTALIKADKVFNQTN